MLMNHNIHAGEAKNSICQFGHFDEPYALGEVNIFS